jgi:CsoR family transcriptional regulator, copper-sensing transcriptional repressor
VGGGARWVESGDMKTVTERAESDVQMRLRRIEGQIRGIIGMLGDGKPCEDVVTQILAARAAMDRVAMEVLKCHVDEALDGRPPAEARDAVLRLMNLMNKVQ